MHPTRLARYTRNLAEAQRAAAAESFPSKSAQADAAQAAGRAYEEVAQAIRDVLLGDDFADRRDHQDWQGVYWGIPSNLSGWRAKNTATVVGFAPAAAGLCEMADGLTKILAAIKAAPVVKPVTKRAAAEAAAAAAVKAVEAGTASPLAMAVGSMRDEAVAEAERVASLAAGRAREFLAGHGFDPFAAAPDATRGASRRERDMAAARRAHLLQFVDRAGRGGAWAWSDEGAARYVAAEKRATAASFNAFILKLEGKIGAHTAARVAAGHTWGYSVIEATMPDGSTQRWQTQRIINCSALGNLFNQWPTRRLK